jgi:hypothetical protein
MNDDGDHGIFNLVYSWCPYAITSFSFSPLPEIPPSSGMEYGAILPEPGHEAEWLASLGLSKKYA